MTAADRGGIYDRDKKGQSYDCPFCVMRGRDFTPDELVSDIISRMSDPEEGQAQ